jgi:hypothetical protein
MFTTRVYLTLFVLAMIITGPMFAQETLPGTSSYSFNLNVLDCDNTDYLRGCRHEIGHKMDDDLGMPSQSDEFLIATRAYAIYQLDMKVNPDPLAMFIRLYPDALPVELYAGIYSFVDGEVSQLPESIRAFYSTDTSYLDLYVCLTDTVFNICGGRNFSLLKG